MDSPIVYSNDDHTVEWINASQIIWIPVQTKAQLHSGKWFLEFDVESVETHHIEVGFLSDWNIGPDWGFFGYLGSSPRNIHNGYKTDKTDCIFEEINEGFAILMITAV
jgi:hypothetical protein